VESALLVTYTDEASPRPAADHPSHVARFLTLVASHPSSIVSLPRFRAQQRRAVRTALTRDAWTAINRAWLMLRRPRHHRRREATLNLLELVKAETRGFEGAIAPHAAQRSPAFISWVRRSSAPTTPRG
jgi:uncharacterized alpha-E superfamily protein